MARLAKPARRCWTTKIQAWSSRRLSNASYAYRRLQVLSSACLTIRVPATCAEGIILSGMARFRLEKASHNWGADRRVRHATGSRPVPQAILFGRLKRHLLLPCPTTRQHPLSTPAPPKLPGGNAHPTLAISPALVVSTAPAHRPPRTTLLASSTAPTTAGWFGPRLRRSIHRSRYCGRCR